MTPTTITDEQGQAAHNAARPLAGCRVALCCQETGLSAALTEVLERCGCAVTGCPCDATRIDDLRAVSPDLVVIESGARDSGAMDLCQTLAKEAAFAGSKTLVLLDNGRAIALRRARALGANAVVALPVGMGTLQAEIGRLLGGA